MSQNMFFLKWKKPYKIEIVGTFSNKKFRKCKLNNSNRRQISGCLGVTGIWGGREQEEEGKITNVHEKCLGGDKYVNNFDCSNDFMSIRICKNLL